MRYQVGQTLFGVFFQATHGGPMMPLMFHMPMLYNNDPIDKIVFVKMEVQSHHKVRNEWDDDSKPADCDGFILKDADGRLLRNQFPLASYGQTTDTGDRRFRRYGQEFTSIAEVKAWLTTQEGKSAYEYHLLTDVLETMKKGVEELPSIDTEVARAKLPLLRELYERTCKEFHEQFPEYQITMEKRKLIESSDLMWWTATIDKK